MQILIGADPEVFVTRGGKPLSAHNMIKGTKAKPNKVKFGATQVDGLALEFNIDPAKTEKQFVHNVSAVFDTLKKMIPEGCEILVVPSVHFDWDHLKEQPAEALAMGCDPDFSAYTGIENEKPNGDTNLRTASGHVHIGWTKGEEPHDGAHFKHCMDLIRQLDFFLGLPSLLVDKDQERRKLYGQAGAFRPKPYGCEYRVLSNFWLKKPELMSWVYNATHLAIKELMAGHKLYDKYGNTAMSGILHPKESYYGLEYIKQQSVKDYNLLVDPIKHLI